MRRAVIAGLALVVLLPAARAKDDKKTGDDKFVFKMEGMLTDKDAKDKVMQKSPHKVHTVDLKADKIYIIDLTSRDFDSYLRLEDSAQRPLAEDDDSGGGLNSRLAFKPQKDGTYRLIATSYDAKPGAYTLTVREPSGEAEVIQAELALVNTLRNQSEKAHQEKRKDAADLADEAERVLTKLAERPLKGPMSKQIEELRFTLKHLTVGRPAMEVEGEDIDGKKFKLSDYRGKVVVLDFWGHW